MIEAQHSYMEINDKKINYRMPEISVVIFTIDTTLWIRFLSLTYSINSHICDKLTCP